MQFTTIKEEMEYFLGSKDAFYAFMLRKQYHMPDIRCSAVNIAYMDQGFKGLLFIARQEECRPIRLATPPSKDTGKRILLELLDASSEVEEGHWALMQHLQDKDADLNWILSMIYFLKPGHDLFTESYFVAPKSRRVVSDEVANAEKSKLQAYEGAFKHIPVAPSSKQRKARNGRRSTVTNAILHERKKKPLTDLQAMEQQLKAIQAENASLKAQREPILHGQRTHQQR